MMAVCLGILGGVQTPHGGIWAIGRVHHRGHRCSLASVFSESNRTQAGPEGGPWVFQDDAPGIVSVALTCS